MVSSSYQTKSRADSFSIKNWLKAGIGITLGNMAVFLLMSLWTVVFWAIAFGISKTSETSKITKIFVLVFFVIGAIPFLPFLIQGVVMAFGQMLGQQLFN